MTNAPAFPVEAPSVPGYGSGRQEALLVRSASVRGGLAPYLPGFLVRRIGARGSVPPACVEEAARAATLFVDLVGFTQLTERIALGAAGAEQVSEILNDYFGRMTTIIDAYGGDVVLYAGDAVLAVWPATSLESLRTATTLAAQCAVEIDRRLSGLELESHVVLRQRAVVGAGAVSFYEIGGLDGHWLPLLAGPALAGVAGAMHDANTGDVILTQESYELLGDRCRVARAAGGHRRLVEMTRAQPSPIGARATDVSDDLLSAYVPEVLASRITAGHGEWIAEFRRVTVVFVGLAGLADGGGELGRIQLAAVAFQRALRQHEGTVYQVAMDDKGTVLIGVFGLPPLAQENDAQRGVEAALAFKSQLSEAGIPGSVGVATGRAFCGTCGTSWRRQYTVVGPAINLAARLMQAADGRLICDAVTEERTRARLHFDAGTPVTVKGLTEPVPVFLPRGRRATALSRPVLVGRMNEQDRLRALVRQLGERRGGVVIVAGAAGIGKSSLLAAAAEDVALLPGVLLRGAGEAIERSTPYFAWRETMRGLLRAGPDEKGQALAERLGMRLDDTEDRDLLRWSPLLNVVLPLGLQDNEITSNMSSEARAGAVQQIVIRLLEKEASHRPVALLFDDVQWLDSASASLARAVAERLPAVLIIAATRPADGTQPAASDALVQAPGAEQILLGPLSTDAVRALVCRRLDVDRVDDAVVQFILERAGGHPFFTEELVRAIEHSDLLEFADGAAVLGTSDIRSVKFPESVHAAITSRVDRLLPHELLALKTASVIGQSFSHQGLRAVYPVESDLRLLEAGLENLERLELIHREGVDAESYVFKHALIHEAVYGLLPASHRRKIHRSVALFYEQRSDGTGAEFHPLLASHWDEAGDAQKAVFYLEKAASEAVKVFSSREAESFLRRAEELSSSDPTLREPVRIAIRESLRGEAAYQQANYGSAHRHFSRSLELRRVVVPSTPSALAVDLALQIGRQIAHRAVPSWLPREPTPARRETLEHVALVFNRFSSLAWYRGDKLALMHSIFKVLNLAEEANDVSNMVHGSAAMAVLCGLVGWHKAASFYSKWSLRMADESKNPSDAARAHIDTAIYAIGSGLWPEAETHVRDALDLHLRLGDTLHWEGSLALHGYLHLARGELPQATACFDEVYQSSRNGRIQSRIWARNGHLAAQIPRGTPPLEMVEELSRLALELPDTAESITAHGLIAHARLCTGDITGAIGSAEFGLRRLVETKPGAVYYAFWGMASLAETWLALWQANASKGEQPNFRRQAEQACRLLRAFSRMMAIARPRSALCDGRLATLAGRPKAAARRFHDGLALAVKLQMPFDEALLRAEVASGLPVGDSERARHLQTAADLLEAQGAHAELERIRGAPHDHPAGYAGKPKGAPAPEEYAPDRL